MNLTRRSDKSNRKRKKVGSKKDLYCTVHFLDQSSQVFRLNGKEKGQALLNQAFYHQSVCEPRYFGLRFLGINCSVQHWVEPDKSLSHQLKCFSGEIHFYFEVKYFVENPSQLAENQTRWLFFLQCWSNVCNGTLVTSPQTSCVLASYYLHLTYGCIKSKEEESLNILKLEAAPKSVKENVTVIIELRELMKDQSNEQALSNFLDHVRRVDLYGVDLHSVKDCDGKMIDVGISSRNISIFRKNARINTFPWCSIVRVFYKKKKFFIQLQREKLDEHDTVVGFRLASRRATKLLWKSCIEQHSFFRLGHPLHSSQISKGTLPFFRKLLSVNSCYNINPPTRSSSKIVDFHRQRNDRSTSTTYRRYDNLHKIQSSTTASPRPAWSSAPNLNDSTGCASNGSDDITKNSLSSSINSTTPLSAFIPSDIHQGIRFADEEVEDFRLPLYLEPEEPIGENNKPRDIRLMADPTTGLYGFNLRYGKDFSSAFFSRIVANSPADCCYPRIHVGDQLVAVNGHPLQCLTQTEVMAQFDGGRQSYITISVKQHGGYFMEQDDEPLQYVHDKSTDISVSESVIAIAEGLRTGRILSAFDVLPRCRPELSTNVAKREDNIRKNRYGDISPYDCNRVVLQSCQDGDYINASYVSLPLPGVNNTLKYIAAQGPLPHTVEDFWSLVWHQRAEVIAMVTPEMERGSIKCHHYWPDLNEIVRTGHLVISCQFEHNFGHYIHREFLLTDVQSGEYRCVSHVQYLDWPDHGAPVSASQFLDYVHYTQSLHSGLYPVVVHCSAGIGRTGAFILLDASLHSIRLGKGVNPISLVRSMRDQRPMMVQTSMQFQYICECIVDSVQE